jgi:cell wall-associated NlpC family hydrolase
MRVARIDASDRRAKLDDAKQASRQALTAVEAKRQAAAAAVQSQKALLAKVNGELATLIAAEQRRKAEEEARRVRAALVSANKAPTGGKLNTDTGKAPVDPPPAPNAGAATAVAEAKKQLGKPYEWAAAGPDSFDCSGLTQWAWKAAGKLLSHYTAAQYNETARVEIKDLQPGDLVFFGSDLHHVGLYVGNGQMIHAPQTGDVVRYDTIYRSDLMQLGGRVR